MSEHKVYVDVALKDGTWLTFHATAKYDLDCYALSDSEGNHIGNLPKYVTNLDAIAEAIYDSGTVTIRK